MTRPSTRGTPVRSTPVPHTNSSDGHHQASDGALAGLAGRNGEAAELLALGRPREAVDALEPLLDECRWLLGDDHPETLVVEGNLAVAYVLVGQEESGALLMGANLAGRERVFGEEHPLTLTARDAVATTHRLAGRLSEALWLYARVAPQRNRVLGSTHPDTLTTRLGLGLTFAEAGDTAMALDVITAALQDCDQTDVEHRQVAILRSCRAELQRADVATAPVAGAPVTRSAAGLPAVPQQRHGSAQSDHDLAPQRGHDGRPTSDSGPGAEPDGVPGSDARRRTREPHVADA